MKKHYILLTSLLLLTSCSKTKTITLDEIYTKKDNKESFLYYVGSSNCSNCDRLKRNIRKCKNVLFYYVDIDSLEVSEQENIRQDVVSKLPSYYFIENGLYNYEISLYTPAIFKVVDGITVCAFETYIDTNLINELNDFNNINLYYYQDFESLYELDYSFKCLFYNGLDEITRNSVESIFNENKNSNTKLFYINYSNLDEVEKNELYHFYYEYNNLEMTDNIQIPNYFIIEKE